MLVQLTSTALTVFHSSFALSFGSASPESILSLVPDDSVAIAHCEDAAALRSRAEYNEWYRLLASKDGAPLLDGLAREFRSGTDTDLHELLAVAKHLTGECALFVTPQVVGFVTVPPPDRAALIASMRDWLPDPAADAVSKPLRIGGAQVEMIAWRAEDNYGWTARKGHFAALVDHPNVLGLFSGDDIEVLSSTIAASLAGQGDEHRAPVVSELDSARAGEPRCHGVELFADLTPFVGGLERDLAESWAGTLPDPTGMLGLDQDFWLHVASDVYSGTRIDCNARLNIPQGTLAASLADTFEPLPSGLPAQLPRGVTQLHALRWNLTQFYTRIRTAIEERHGADSLESLDALIWRETDDEEFDMLADLLSQFEGTFAVFELPTGRRDTFDFEDFNFLASLRDGAAFRIALDRLIGIRTLDDVLEPTLLEETEVFMSGGGDDDFGLALLPKLMLIGFKGNLIRSLRAVNGVADASLLDGSAMHAAFDQQPGCCAISIQALSAFEPAATQLMGSTYRIAPVEGEETGRSPFDSLLMHTIRRTPSGLRFELQAQ